MSASASSWSAAMRTSESGRPLLRNGARSIDVEEEDNQPDERTPGEEMEMTRIRDMARDIRENKFEYYVHMSQSAGCPMCGSEERSVKEGRRSAMNLGPSMATTVRLDFHNSCFYNGKQIDYVLAYEDEDEDDQDDVLLDVGTSGKDKDLRAIDDDLESETMTNERLKRKKRRKHFEENLRKMGLELTEIATDPSMGRTCYVLVHAPLPILERQAQLLNVKLPVKKCDVEHAGRALMPGCVDKCLDRMRFLDFDEETKLMLEEPDYYTATYSSDRRHNFVMWNMPDHLFPSSERSRMVYDLLVRARYRAQEDIKTEDDRYSNAGLANIAAWFSVGIERLLANGTYTGAYPLHQKLRSREEMKEKSLNQRELLYTCWASWRAWYKYQPLDLVKRYFGSKVGLYFAWLGYYTKALYPAAIFGLICVFFGILQFTKDPVSISICSDDRVGGRIITCPACNDYCDFQYLNSSCVYAKVSYLFDNTLTVVFAALMSIWATLFLEGWKRYHAEVAWKWGLMDFAVDEDTVRPEFQYRVKTTKWNPITRKHEPYLNARKRMLNCLASSVTVIFFVLLVLGVVFGVVVYRVICLQLLASYNNTTVDKYAFLIVTATAAMLNLIVILIMNYVYYYLALILTRWECPRTQNDFDNSFTFKVFLFQFVNYYSSLFYIAFFKGILAQLPGYTTRDRHGGALHIGGARLEGCDPAGCFAELVIQLAIIMCGRQFFSAFIELGYPYIMSCIRRWQFLQPKKERTRAAKVRAQRSSGLEAKRWEEDYFLSPTYDQWLFDEYLEMVIQFGFITLFVAAFPLAPIFALLNNIMEIRLDAYKFLVTTQRPMPAQSRNIGIWLEILQFLSNISVTINALVIAFTSDFVPKTYYMYAYNWDLRGYMNWALSHFDARNLTLRTPHIGMPTDVVDCRFRGFRNVPCSLVNASTTPLFSSDMISAIEAQTCDPEAGYSYAQDWWKILALRLIFVVVFEHVVFLVKTLVDYLIPDVPTKIFLQQQREKYLARKAVLDEFGSSRNASFRETSQPLDVNRHAFQPGRFETTDHHDASENRDASAEASRRRISDTISTTSFETATEGYQDARETNFY